MERNNQTTKWLSGLFFLSLLGFALGVIKEFTINDNWASWVQKAISAGIVVCLYCLRTMQKNYRFSALCRAVTLLLSLGVLLVGTFLLPILTAAERTDELAIISLFSACLSVVISVFSILGAWLEMRAHGLLVSQEEPALAAKWRKLFLWQLAFSLLYSIGTSVTTALLMSFQWDVATVAPVWTILQLPVKIVRILYLYYLYKTIRIARRQGEEE